jgi:signal transduction histidine kinase
LAICKMIVDKLGGRIGFASAPGMGTTFYFDLPERKQAVQPNGRNLGAMRI